MNQSLEGQVKLETVIDKLTYVPRSILHQITPSIKEAEVANLTLFIPNKEFTFEANMIHSKSKNTSLVGSTLKGRVIGVINGKESAFNTK